jgi:hypothetical protein
MGVVYRARDTRLDREVALKVLPEALVEDAGQLARFEREAKLLAALNHPNVAAIYGIDHVEGVHFLTLELVPGDTLRKRLAGGPLSVDDAVRISQQIAAGLQAAHATGIIHRDLKPGNIIIRPDGSVKILDFGLAKQTDVADRSRVEPITEAFQVMGTPGYLSPEQASGEIADERADVWAFGCILFECLTGQRAFPGETVGERIRAMFEESPDFDALPEQTPPTVRLLVSRCLARDSSSRLGSIGDVKLLLEGALEHESQSSGIPPVVAPAPARPQRWPWVALAGGLLVAGLFAFWSPRGDDSPTTDPGARQQTLALALPLGAHLGWRETSAALSKLGRGSPLIAGSPDGTRVAYCVEQDDQSWIHIHAVEELDSIRLPGTEDGRAPFFSPDGKRIGFQARKSLKVVAADGNSPAIEICEVVSSNFSACWSANGIEIIYSTPQGLRIVSLTGEERSLTTRNVEAGEVEHLQPTMAGADHVLFTVATGTGAHISLCSTDPEGETHRIVRKGTSPRFVDGRIYYAHEGSVRVAPFDPTAPNEIGLSRHVLPGVYATPGAGGGSVTAHFDVAASGAMAYVPAPKSKPKSIARWVPRESEGKGTVVREGIGIWKHPRLSPDEQYFVVDVLDAAGRKNILKLELERDARNWLTQDGISIMSAWHPDARVTLRNTHFPLIRFMLGAGAPFPPEIGLQGTIYADSWTQGGRTLFLTMRKPNGYSVWSYTLGAQRAEPLFDDNRTARFARISPDGRWLVYVAQEKNDGKLEVFLRAYRPSLGERIKVSHEGGGEPMWSKDGKEIFFRKVDGSLLFVSMDQAPKFESERLWGNEYDPEPGGHQHYDLSRDGRFLMIENVRIVPNRVHVISVPEPAESR